MELPCFGGGESWILAAAQLSESTKTAACLPGSASHRLVLKSFEVRHKQASAVVYATELADTQGGDGMFMGLHGLVTVSTQGVFQEGTCLVQVGCCTLQTNWSGELTQVCDRKETTKNNKLFNSSSIGVVVHKFCCWRGREAGELTQVYERSKSTNNIRMINQ